MSKTRVPAIPLPTPANLLDVSKAIKNIIDVREGYIGDPLDQNVTYRDLVEAGAMVERGSWNKNSGVSPVVPPWYESDGYDPTADLTAPPAPTGFTATGGLAVVLLKWDALPAGYRNHAYAEVWRATTNAIGNAVLIGTSATRFYTDSVGSGATNYYWIRFVSQADVKGPYNSTNGVSGTTGQDPAYLLSVLNASITSSQLATTLNTRIDLIDAAATTPGSVNARIAVVQGQVNDLLNIPAYNNSTTYSTSDQVTYNGALYRALSTTVGHLPTNTTYWQKIGDYTSLGDAVAANTTDIINLGNDLGTEVSARSTLASQLRGSYTGTDLALLSSGLIYQERVARANAVSAVATDVTTLSATLNTKTRVYFQTTAPAGPRVDDIWVDTSPNYSKGYFSENYSSASHRQFRWDGSQWVDVSDYALEDNYSAITLERTARVEADLAIATDITTLFSNVAQNVSAITEEATTRSTADTALATQISTLTATVNTNNTTNSAAIQSEATARATADGALAETISTVQTAVDGNTTSIQTNASSIDGIRGSYTVKIDNNGVLSGFGLTSDVVDGNAVTSKFIISANQFAVIAPNRLAGALNSVPFAVLTTAQTINGVSFQPGVYIDGASINAGTIGSAQIGNAVIDDAKISSLDAAKITTGYIDADRIEVGTLDAKIANIDAAVITSGTIGSARIADASITSAKIASAIQSSNYSAGTSGWQLSKSGTFEMNDGTINLRSATSGARMELKNNVIKVYDASGTIRVKIGDLAA